MRKTLSILILGICCYLYGCEKNVSQTPPLQKLLISGAWSLRYTDSFAIDNNNNPLYYRIPAPDCATQGSIAFKSGFTYQQKFICNQAVPQVLSGQWIMSDDSSLAYGLTSDTIWNNVFIHKISADSLEILEFHSYDTSVYHRPIYVLDVYGH
jgi:hypothetical protein